MSPKTKDKKNKCLESCCTALQNSRVLIIPRTCDSVDLDLVQLRHPASGRPAYFLFSNVDSQLYELLTFSDQFRSFFIGTSVMSDGRMYVMTRVDPLFLLLPYLSASVHCSPLDQVLRDDEFPQIERLATCPTLTKRLHKISNVKGVSVLGYEYDEEKTLKWLVEKVKRSGGCLLSNSVNVTTCHTVQSNNYLKHSSSIPTHITEDYLRFGFGVVSEYLTSDLSRKLEEKLALTPLDLPVDNNQESIGKRGRSPERFHHTVDIKRSKPQQQPTLSTPVHLNVKTGGSSVDKSSAKQKARAKAAAGTKSISCFFTKTPGPAST